MHNIHFLRVQADTADEAMQHAENEVSDWGNENNWRTICGAVSKKGKVTNSGEGRYSPKDTGYTTFAKIKKAIDGWMDSNFYGNTAKEKLAKGETDLNKWGSQELWSLQQHAKHLGEVRTITEHGKTPKKGFDVFSDTFYEYQYDECGLTDCGGEGKETFIVLLDMHS